MVNHCTFDCVSPGLDSDAQAVQRQAVRNVRGSCSLMMPDRRSVRCRDVNRCSTTCRVASVLWVIVACNAPHRAKAFIATRRDEERKQGMTNLQTSRRHKKGQSYRTAPAGQTPRPSLEQPDTRADTTEGRSCPTEQRSRLLHHAWSHVLCLFLLFAFFCFCFCFVCFCFEAISSSSGIMPVSQPCIDS